MGSSSSGPVSVRRSLIRPLGLAASITSVLTLACWQAAAVTAAAAVAVPETAAAASAASAVARLSPLSLKVNDRVIVVMKGQPAVVRPGSRAFALRSAAIASTQAPLLRQLRLTRATRIKTYRLVNALAATVSPAEAASLRANPGVADVIPDVMIQGGSVPLSKPGPAVPSADPSPKLHVIPQACGSNGQALLDPEALQTTNTASATPGAKTARSLGITGQGVEVAFLADGLATGNVNFIRPDGRSVFDPASGGDYQDFSGDGPGRLTGGAEAFLDANSIAGQGIHVYNVRTFSAQHDSAACDIRIEGVAPGASLVGLDVFGTFDATLESNFLEAIDYAVRTDHVNVLNESFGSNPFPDSTALNVTEQFNDAAVAAGTTVTVSTGDSGSTNTIASPASDPKVISVGASTTFRFYAQTNYAATRYFATTGWLDDNVSSISSGGLTATGRTVSLVAPGDAGFASCSTHTAIYQGCSNFTSSPSPVELSGGTSESAPLTAGAAALVIQAYRQAHGGSTPSPALVKQILTSTATDLGLPASEQGAGLLNSYKAVLLAKSIRTSAGSPAPVGDTLLASRGALTATGPAGSSRSWKIKVTNTGADSQLVRASGRTFGPDQQVQTGSVRLNDNSSPEFTDDQGSQNDYELFHFTVRPGAARLTASIAYQNLGNSPDRLILIDPRGRFAADSLPQGTGDFGSADVRAPVPGAWTGVIFGPTGSGAGAADRVPWRVATQHFASFGTVSPATLLLQPGQSRTLLMTATLPARAGDASGSVVLTSDVGGVDSYLGTESESIPVTLRSMVNLSRGGSFSGVLTGGNGRAPGIGQVNYFKFRVGSGHRGITANVALTNDAADVVASYLIAPDGQALGFGQNTLDNVNKRTLTAYTLDPVPGIWTLAVDFTGPVVGDEISQRFSGSIRLDNARATATGLPDTPHRALKRGVPVTIGVRVTNTGLAPEDYFIDPRLARKATFELQSQTGQTFLLPLGTQPEWLVPTQISSARVTAKGNVPIVFDWGPTQGVPDLFAPASAGDRASGTFTPAGGSVEPGNWVANPDQLGPYPQGAPDGSVTVAMTVTGQPFDHAMMPATGDLWLTSVSLLAPVDPVTIAPGKSAVIKVTLRPAGAPGTVVRGILYVDDFVASVPPYGQTTGDELVAIPYAYKIK